MIPKRVLSVIRFPAVIGAAAFAILAIFGSGLFFARKPVVVVSDAAFESLYGEGRAASERRLLAISVFRPVRLALVSENAAPQASADIARNAAGSGVPRCVLFPSRYLAGARIFAERFPDIPVVVVGESVAENIPSLVPDRLTDLYRAGRVSALFAATRPPVLLTNFVENPLFKSAFAQGLSDAGFSGNALFFQSGDRSGASMPVDAFVTDAASADQSSSAILFSWADPSFFPEEIVMVFDDSLYAFAYSAYRAGLRGVSAERASRVRVFLPKKKSMFLYMGIQAAANARRH